MACTEYSRTGFLTNDYQITADNTLNQDALNRFFAKEERRAFVMARIALNNPDEALDVVQDAMLKHFRHYAKYPEAQWGPLFQRVLQNCINDRFRKRSLTSRFFAFFQSTEEQDDRLYEEADAIELTPPAIYDTEDFAEQFETLLRQLPERQRQVFLLRAWEGYSIQECADIMGCATGSVKAHYYRAQKKLQQQLNENTMEPAGETP